MSCKKLTFEEKEMAILRDAVDKAEERTKRASAMSPEITEMMLAVEDFLRKTKCICYGGTAINNILPVSDQFYDKNLEIPDYDFYSRNALKDAKELADIYAKFGWKDVEAKAGVHHGTFKVYVNYIPVADITQMDLDLFKSLKKDAIKVNGILYTPANFLRMAMYLELSRPKGDVSRWEKVLKRLNLLNKNYPLENSRCNYDSFRRGFENNSPNKDDQSEIYDIARDSLISQGLVFFGGYANDLYSHYMPKNQSKTKKKIPDFDVLSERPKIAATILKERLMDAGFKRVKITKRKGVGEVIAPHYEISIGPETIAFIYEPLACHSYNIIHVKGAPVKVATIDTMLSFYLAFIYANRPYYDRDRILCMAQYLFKVQEKNRLQQKGLLKRFSIKCIGNQDTLMSVRQHKAKMYEKLKSKRGTKEYDEWFLKYSPTANIVDTEVKKKKKRKTRKARKKSKKTRKNRRSEYLF
tara:strand:+ start:2749 stop:4155 length:1407 start_codon:yes stop_codon:yes gene_type:complete